MSSMYCREYRFDSLARGTEILYAAQPAKKKKKFLKLKTFLKEKH